MSFTIEKNIVFEFDFQELIDEIGVESILEELFQSTDTQEQVKEWVESRKEFFNLTSKE